MANGVSFASSAFVNCPFDREYDHILQAILFCLIRFGLNPRIATERSDSAEPRVQKILQLIKSCRYSIHDLSRCQARHAGEHYRLNMPFELGVDFGCRHYGSKPLKDKVLLILEEKPYRYQATISDLAGCDIKAHRGDYAIAVRKLRNWLIDQGGFERVGAAQILAEYEDFQEWHYDRELAAGSSEEDIQDYSTADLMRAMFEWLDLGRPRT